MRNLQRLTPLTLMAALLLAAAALRIIGWIDAPPGMRYDEMTVVVEADDIRLGDRPIYMDGSAEEPLYHYLFAITEDTIGPSLFAQRWLSAMLGVIAIAAIYALGRQMFNARLGLITAAISVAALWTLMYSRMGLRIVALAPRDGGKRRMVSRQETEGGALALLQVGLEPAGLLVPKGRLARRQENDERKILNDGFLLRKEVLDNWHGLQPRDPGPGDGLFPLAEACQDESLVKVEHGLAGDRDVAVDGAAR